MAQTPEIKIGTTVRIDGNVLTVSSIHKGYITALDKKGKPKIYTFEKVESECLPVPA